VRPERFELAIYRSGGLVARINQQLTPKITNCDLVLQIQLRGR